MRKQRLSRKDRWLPIAVRCGVKLEVILDTAAAGEKGGSLSHHVEEAADGLVNALHGLGGDFDLHPIVLQLHQCLGRAGGVIRFKIIGAGDLRRVLVYSGESLLNSLERVAHCGSYLHDLTSRQCGGSGVIEVIGGIDGRLDSRKSTAAALKWRSLGDSNPCFRRERATS